MRKRNVIVAGVAAAVVLGGSTFAVAGGKGLIWDDGHYAKPGSLDDGKELLSRTTITLGQAVAAAQQAASGQLGQVDLQQAGSRVVYKVDVGANEVSVDASDGSIAAVEPQS